MQRLLLAATLVVSCVLAQDGNPLPIQDGKPMPIQGEDLDKGPRPHLANARPAYPDMKANYNFGDRNGPHFSDAIVTVQNRAFTELACNSTTHVQDGTQVLFKKSTESCWYDFLVYPDVEYHFYCPVFRASCTGNNQVAHWDGATGAYTEHCYPDDETIDITISGKPYYYWATAWYDVWGDVAKRVTCRIVGTADAASGTTTTAAPTTTTAAPTTTTTAGSGTTAPPQPTTCGQSGSSPSGRIIEGGFASQQEYPWQAYIWSNIGACGATIIDNQWLLTAAHCVPEPSTGNQINACIGSNSRNSCKKIISSTKIIAHSGYTFDDTNNVYPHDIALAKLSEALVYDNTIKPVCLPTSASEKPAAGTDIEIAGWGLVDTESTSTDLKKAWMKVVSSNQCHNDSFKLVCLKTDGSTNSPTGRACSGDSGGYAGARNANDQAVQYGVASFVYVSDGACIEPNAYTDVAYHIDWINQQMAAN